MSRRRRSDTPLFQSSGTASTLVSFAQWTKRHRQEDFFGSTSDSFYCLCDGLSHLPNGDHAAELARDTACFAYEQLHLRQTYRKDKRQLVTQIFRLVHDTLLREQKQPSYDAGIGVVMSMVILGDRKFWVGSVGDVLVSLVRGGFLQRLSRVDSDQDELPGHYLGQQTDLRGVQFAAKHIRAGDTILLATDGLYRMVSDENVRRRIVSSRMTQESSDHAAALLLSDVASHGGVDDASLAIIRRYETRDPFQFTIE